LKVREHSFGDLTDVASHPAAEISGKDKAPVVPPDVKSGRGATGWMG
jgi:hypothetical protein